MKRIQHHQPSRNTLADIDTAVRKRAGQGLVEDVAICRSSLSTNSGVEDDSGYEYLNHTADIQLHAWGQSLSSALENLVLSMFGYMTSLENVEIDEQFSYAKASNIEAEGHDMKSMIFNFLDNWLFSFHCDYFIAKEITVKKIDLINFKVTSSGKGEKLNVGKHDQGTEVKAITYSNMQVEEDADRCDIWVIVDI